MNDQPQSKRARIRIVPEASPPLDNDDQLQLDDALAALGDQLRSEAQWLHDLAQDPQATPTTAIDDSLQRLATQLTSESQQLFDQAGQADLARPAASAIKTKPAWMVFAYRMLPVVAAASLLAMVWARPLNRSQQATPSGNDASSVARLPEATPLDPFAPAGAVAAPVPWQEMSSPELEGALDLVDEAVSISI